LEAISQAKRLWINTNQKEAKQTIGAKWTQLIPLETLEPIRPIEPMRPMEPMKPVRLEINPICSIASIKGVQVTATSIETP
jgi:hypothetical protein